MQEAVSGKDSPYAILEQNLSLQQVVARKTEELETERHELQRALEELRLTQAQLLQAQKMESVGQLAAGIAHEINTPTQYVMDNVGFIQTASGTLLGLVDKAVGLAEVARPLLPEAEAMVEFDATLKRARLDFLRRQIPGALDESLEGLGHISRIVAAMKEFSHPSGGEKEPVDMRELIATTLTVARNEWKYVAEVETRFADDLPSLPCQRDMIGQVVLNLVVNAAHAIAGTLREGVRDKGRIEISAACRGDAMEIRVCDDGSGIPIGIRDRIFDPFFTTKAVGKGTGQGLAIAYSTVVDKHQGEIFCESEEGVGSCFVVRLPLDGGAGRST
ncbi:ATP-binding protein [Nitrogeniibacter mangrovi]|uniref:histidine kinase n=2 Tax=Nitrogeniibacter mangrovi TaxID=2016596 RepID=A0A6C1BAI3_9RHOO|nr:ATP-binding protein [Nitrogeniibacter mangrovi]